MATAYRILNAEERAKSYPDTFFIPSLEDRESIEPGSLVKLIFSGRDSSGRAVNERMWVRVESRGASRVYRGQLDNDPVFLRGLRRGDRISFRPIHVTEIITKTGALTATVVLGAAVLSVVAGIWIFLRQIRPALSGGSR